MLKRLGIVGIVFTVLTVATFGLALLFQSHERLRDKAVRLLTVRGAENADGYVFVPFYRWRDEDTLLLFQFAYQKKPMRMMLWNKKSKTSNIISVPEITHRLATETSDSVALSPDGSRLLVPIPNPRQSGTRPLSYPVTPMEYTPMLFPLVQGGKATALSKTIGSIQWMPDGSLVTLRRDSNPRILPRTVYPRRGVYIRPDPHLVVFSDTSNRKTLQVVSLNLARSLYSSLYSYHQSQLRIVAAGKSHLLLSGLPDVRMGSGRSSVRLLRAPLNGGAPADLYRAAPGTSEPLELVAVSRDGERILWRENAAQRMRLHPKAVSFWDTVRDTVENWYYAMTRLTKPGTTPFALWETDGAGMGIRLVAEYIEDGQTKDTRASNFQYLPSGTHFSFRQDGSIWTRPVK